MSLKAVLFDFNGVIIKDLPLHLKLIDEILVQENLQPQRMQERQAFLGHSDRACLEELLKYRGRLVTEEYVSQLLNRKAKAYALELEKLETVPLYPGLEDFIFQLRSRQLKLGIVSGALRQEIEPVLARTKLGEYFHVVVAGDDLITSKPKPDCYLLALKQLNEKYPNLNLQPQECLAIEDTPIGITSAKHAKIQVVAVANTYPFHMLQRQANWTVDYLTELELERIEEIFAQKGVQPSVSEC